MSGQGNVMIFPFDQMKLHISKGSVVYSNIICILAFHKLYSIRHFYFAHELYFETLTENLRDCKIFRISPLSGNDQKYIIILLISGKV